MATETEGPVDGHARGRRRPPSLVLLPVALLLVACGGTDAGGGAGPAGTVTLYTCLSDESVQPVIAAFQDASGTQVDLFRAWRPTCAPAGSPPTCSGAVIR